MNTKFHIPNASVIGDDLSISYSDNTSDFRETESVKINFNDFNANDEGVLTKSYDGELEVLLENNFKNNKLIDKGNIFFVINLGDYRSEVMIIEPLRTVSNYNSNIYGASSFELASIINLASITRFDKGYKELTSDEKSDLNKSIQNDIAIKSFGEFTEEKKDEFAPGVSAKKKVVFRNNKFKNLDNNGLVSGDGEIVTASKKTNASLF